MLPEIKEILELAVNAPSGHNSQPWRFVIQDNTIQIFNIPDKDKTLFNWKQKGSLTAHGTLIENIVNLFQKALEMERIFFGENVYKKQNWV
jgi:hypothetical protein